MRLIAIALLLAAAACGRDSLAAELRRQARSSTDTTATFIAHPDHIQPGLSLQRPLANLRNPYGAAKPRVDEGSTLFVSYNCMDCHGADGSGGMGPSLGDGRWHFGGTDGDVFQSIYEGRPDGMPAWGGRISDEQIWALVSYVQSLGVGKNVATENFTGAKVATQGH